MFEQYACAVPPLCGYRGSSGARLFGQAGFAKVVHQTFGKHLAHRTRSTDLHGDFGSERSAGKPQKD
ncbi:hypothetical protein RvY_19124-2 [Ramazzottius varieornatus]|uniref:Uncharacterized protein n=1 Tax=Ramazzottius varieornatus TaxID=947166 RepID=A0A1D1W8D0_RAMVA|nr:hypothetical protein RvY_19124-2 [Ramazzottius varieornatus]